MFTRLLVTCLACAFSSLVAQAQPPAAKPDPLKEAQAALKALGPAPTLPAKAQRLATNELSPEEEKLLGSWSAGPFGSYTSRKIEFRKDRTGRIEWRSQGGFLGPEERIDEEAISFGIEKGELWIAGKDGKKRTITPKEYMAQFVFSYARWYTEDKDKNKESYFKGTHPFDKK